MKRLISLYILLCITASIWAQDISFRGNAPSSVAAGERFHVTYTLKTQGQNGREIRVPDVAGLQQLFGPATGTQMSSSFSGGQSITEYSNTFTYTYLISEVGTYTIPPATIKVGNSTYKANEIKIEAVAADKAISRSNNSQQSNNQAATIGSDEIFVRVNVSKREVYENEGFLVTFKLYTLHRDMNWRPQIPNFDGFIAQDIELNQTNWEVDTYNGRQYYAATIKQSILFPIKSGQISIASGKFEAEIKQRVINRNAGFFDPPYTTQIVKRTLTTPATTINVKPLPAGKPASFTGAVGEYTMKSSMTPSELKTDEAVTVKVNISGSGNIKYVKNPPVVFPNDFDVLDPKVQESSKVTQSGVTGSKTIENYAIPRYAGKFTIPAVEFSYFDIKTQAYKTLRSDDFLLTVEQGEGSTASPTQIISGTNKEDIKYLGQDIRHIRTGSPSFEKGTYLWGSIGYWLWYIVPLVLFIVLFIIFRQQAAQNSNIALTRRKKANKVAGKRLKEAHKFLKEDKKEPFYEEISKAVWGYLGDKLNMPAAALTKDNIEAELSRKNIDPALISQFIEILNTAEFARFAPSSGHQAMDELYHSAVEAINKMEK